MNWDNAQAFSEGWVIDHSGALRPLDGRYSGFDESGREIDANRGLRRHLKKQFLAGSAYHVAAIAHLRAVNEGTYSDIMTND